MTYDLLLQGGTLLDPAQTVHARKDVAFAQGRVAAIADAIPAAQARECLDCSGHFVSPGWIDLHVHVFAGVSHYGIPPDPYCLAHGVTTAVDAGSAGADTFGGLRRYVLEPSQTRLYAFLNIASQGMISIEIGELEDIRWASVPKALACVEAHRDLIVGLKVRLTRGHVVSEASGMRPLHIAREAADAANLPLMVHPQAAWCDALDDVLAVLNEGDILTHSFHGHAAHTVLDTTGKVRPAVRAARERGVIFDVGHGVGSFYWEIAERATAQDFLPDVISSDLHVYNIDGPVFDLATTMSKFLYLGLPLDEVVSRVTVVPAGIIRREAGLGSLAAGAPGDAVVFDVQNGDFMFQDSDGQFRTGRQRIVPCHVIRAGQLYRPQP